MTTSWDTGYCTETNGRNKPAASHNFDASSRHTDPSTTLMIKGYRHGLFQNLSDRYLPTPILGSMADGSQETVTEEYSDAQLV